MKQLPKPIISLTEAQKDAVKYASTHNTIVFFDTGTGKTYIAIELINQLLSQNPKAKIAFLTPTQILCEQQFKVLNKFCNAEVSLYHGKCLLRANKPTLHHGRSLVGKRVSHSRCVCLCASNIFEHAKKEH